MIAILYPDIPLCQYPPPESLPLDQANDLRWAASKEGKLAQNFLKWNTDSLGNLNCKKDVKQLGVTLELQGRKATEGSCTIQQVVSSMRTGCIIY